jgi:hypothetical protein
MRQTPIFDPIGLAESAYWYLFYPHNLMFGKTLTAIAAQVQSQPLPRT